MMFEMGKPVKNVRIAGSSIKYGKFPSYSRGMCRKLQSYGVGVNTTLVPTWLVPTVTFPSTNGARVPGTTVPSAAKMPARCDATGVVARGVGFGPLFGVQLMSALVVAGSCDSGPF